MYPLFMVRNNGSLFIVLIEFSYYVYLFNVREVVEFLENIK